MEWTHVQNGLELFVHIAKSELTLFQAPHQLFVFFEAQLGHFLYQSFDVTHAQELLYERLDFELLEFINVFTSTDKDDGRMSGRNTEIQVNKRVRTVWILKAAPNLRRQSTAAFCMTVQLGNDYRADIDRFWECTRLGFTSLTNWRIHNEDDIVRILEVVIKLYCRRRLTYNCIRDLEHLLKQWGFLFVAAWRVNNDDFEVFL